MLRFFQKIYQRIKSFVSHAMQHIDHIYYFPLDTNGHETGEALLIDLNKDGSVNLSQLPKDIAETMMTLGVSDPLHFSRLFPHHGHAFLEALLHSTDGYRRFRRTNQSI